MNNMACQRVLAAQPGFLRAHNRVPVMSWGAGFFARSPVFAETANAADGAHPDLDIASA